MSLCLWGFSGPVGYWSGLPCPPTGKICCTNKQFLEYQGLSTIKYFWRAHTKPCVHQNPGERSNDPTGAWTRLAHECPGVSSRGMGWWWPAAGSGALSAVGPFEESRHYLHYLHHSLASGQTTGREHSPAYQQKISLQDSISPWISEPLFFFFSFILFP